MPDHSPDLDPARPHAAVASGAGARAAPAQPARPSPTVEPPDHRELGRDLDLFHFQDEAPGMVFWHPRGLAVHSELCAAARRRCRAEGYREVRTPQVLRDSIWKCSGHWTHFRDDMYAFDDGKLPVALKPVSCPGHLEIARRRSLSYRDLPLRIAEFGLCHRREPSGALHGLFRLRQFTQDDGHVLCLPEQVDAEVARFVGGLVGFYAAFGFEQVDVRLATRPAMRAGDDALWDRAETRLAAAARGAGLQWSEQPGGGAFYGPKLEFGLHDAWGRVWQCGTIQLDLQLPARFGVEYARADGERAHPDLLHRALYGSVERFLGILLESTAGRLPPWLAPEQVRVLPVAHAQFAAARELAEAWARAGLRAELDDSRETLAARIWKAHAEGVPYAVVIGERERLAGSATVRERGGRVHTATAEAALGYVRATTQPPV